jgi:hypothetical protein
MDLHQPIPARISRNKAGYVAVVRVAFSQEKPHPAVRGWGTGFREML